MINVLVIVMEAITMWLCLHIAFGEKIKKTKGEALFFVVYIPVFIFCSFGVFIEVLYFLLWVFIAIWCKFKFKRKVLDILARTVIGIILLGLIETVVMFVYSVFVSDGTMSIQVECVVMSSFSLLISLLIYRTFVENERKNIKIFFDGYIFVLGILVLAFLFYVKLEFELNRKVPNVYVFFFVIFSVVFALLYKKQRSIYELEKKTINVELQNMYGKAYEDLLNQVRRKQHDYNNQLTTIYSMYTIANTFDELKCMQENYLGIIDKEREFDDILINCDNSIIAGYLYSMCIKFKSEGIRLNVDVKIHEKEINNKTKDILEVLGILLDNAMEYLVTNDDYERLIDLKIYQKDEKTCIEIRNPSIHMSYEKIGKMFKRGYSTKGEDRGIGLPLLNDIVKKYKGDLYVNNILIKNDNWLVFDVSL